VTAATPAPPDAGLEQLLRRMRLPHIRRIAPEVLAVARAQRWDPAEVLWALLADATGCICWLPRTRSCAGIATSSAAAGPPVRCEARPAGQLPAGTSGPWSSGWPARTPAGATAGSTGNWPAWGTSLGVDAMGDLEERQHRSRAAAERASLVAVPALPAGFQNGA
jgi:hypothetical protein